MRELSEEYEGRVKLSVLPATGEEGLEARKSYGWHDELHGLVTLRPDGARVGDLPGHQFGKDEIKQKIEELLEHCAK